MKKVKNEEGIWEKLPSEIWERMKKVKNEVKNEEGIWEKLPSEIWEGIGKRLENRLDIDSFRSVCKTWRTCLSCPSRFPLRVPAPPGASATKVGKLPFFIVEDSFYAYERTLTRLAEIDQGGKYLPRYFMSMKEMMYRYCQMIAPPRPNISDLTFLFKGYILFIGVPCDNLRVGGEWRLRPCSNLHKKVVIFSPPGVDPRYARVNDLTVAAHLPGGEIALLRLADVDLSWDTDFCRSSYKDIANYKNKLYAVDSLGRAFQMAMEEHRMTQVSQGLFTPGNSKNMRLVGALEQLYLLVVEPESEWEVYKLSEQEERWVYVENLGDLLFFVDREYAFCAPRHVFENSGFLDLKYEQPAYFSSMVCALLFSSDDADKQKQCCSVPLNSRCWNPPRRLQRRSQNANNPTPTSLVLSQFQNSGITMADYLGF